ncbi:hypothetical protein BSK65_29640 [Paenibacillus odorifer]|uniref:Uncharacterized protein n=2 Tax=Paenibacillus TaxID=44249 RepID=A0A1R0Z7L9_9BACL|nr:hypothetical protein BSK65_29640 [Paenibacillus odorifer]
MENIGESKAARETSNYGEYLKREKELLKEIEKKRVLEGTGNGGRIISSVDDLSDTARSKITTSQQATLNLHDRVYTHVTPDDLLGAEKELNGIPLLRKDGSLVLREDGMPFNHMQEVSDSYRGLEKLKKSYDGIIKNPNLDSELRQLYTSKINEVNVSMNKIEDIFAPFGGILPPK